MLREVIARLKESACPPLVEVEGAAAFAALRAPPQRLPRAYVLPASDTAGRNQRISGTAQQVSSQISLLVLAGSKRDARGEAAALDLEQLLQAIRPRLHGWAPGVGFEGFDFVAGRMLRIDEGVLHWEDRFSTSHMMFGGA